MDKQIKLRFVAAAISVALGSTAALAQPEADEDAFEQPQAQSPDIGQPQAQSPDIGQPEAQSPDIGQPEAQSPDIGQPQSEEGRQQQARAEDVGSAQIDELTQQDEDLRRFVEALQTTGLADALTDGTEYTIFAPTNEALDTMQGRSLEELQQPGNEELTALLRAHIVADNVDEEMARNISAATTLDGGTVRLSSEGEQLMVGDATVQGEPIEVGSLRVYKIDGVLEPSADRTQVAIADERETEDAEEGRQGQDESIFGDEAEDEDALGDEAEDPGVFGDDAENPGAERQVPQEQGEL